jgi:hypothetical protein
MRYFLDTEFIEDGKTIDLVSIGIVAEDGREYYALNYDCDWSKASKWVKDNVLTHLPQKPLPCFYVTVEDFKKSVVGQQGWRNKSTIALEVELFVGADNKPEFWAYYADYDWVVFCQLFGKMMDLPKGFPMYCRDIKQECDRLGNPKLPEQGKGEHDALQDAQWNKLVWEFLRNYEESKLLPPS